MLGIDFVIPHMFAKRIEVFIGKNSNLLRRVLSVRGEQLVEMAETIQVEDYALDRWVLKRLTGGQQ